MTTIQSFMLSVSFGAVVGMLIANVGFIIKCAINSHKEKKRKRMEEQNNQ